MAASSLETNLEIEAIGNLCFGKDGKRLRFHIPSYQRGYRWTNHVTKLMDDIYDFTESVEKKLNVGNYYCLQPIVMKRRVDLDNAGKEGKAEIGYEVVDGQQRLTTVIILLNVLGHSAERPVFRISYERDNELNAEREVFLRDLALKTDAEYKKADFFYIRQAFCSAEEWLKQKSEKLGMDPRYKLLPVLHNQVKVIWYELPDKTDGREHFYNINAGKIQLTDAELVKAMMLNSKYYQIENSGETGVRASTVRLSDRTTRMKQELIARVWDDCARSLQGDDFWGFISCEECPRSKRMDFLLELYCKTEHPSDTKTGDATISAFFEDLLTDEESIQNTWHKICELFRRIQDWFGNISMYNYIGLLVHHRGEKKNTLLDFINKSTKQSNSEFQKWILKTIHKEIRVDKDEFNQMNFDEDKTRIKWMLILFNIMLMNSPGRRFNFTAKEGWSVEHVFARKSVDVNESDRKEWVKRHLRVVESRLKDAEESSIADIKVLSAEMAKIDNNTDFDKLFSDYLRLIEKPEGDIDNIGNLALLGLEENKKLQNASFYDKRKKIIEMMEEGRNIPIGTERVFLKSFPDSGTSLDYWNKEDGELYLKYMQKIIYTGEDD